MNPIVTATALLALAAAASAQTVVFTDDFNTSIPAAITPGAAFLEGVFVGAPDCWLLLDAALTSAYPMTLAGTSASTTIPLPTEQSVIGFQLYAQGWAVAPGLNTGGLVFSAGLRLVIGR